MTENIQDPELTDDEKKMLTALLSDEQDMSGFGESRRLFLKQLIGAGGAVLAFQLLGDQSIFAHETDSSFDNFPENIEHAVSINFKVNGAAKSLKIDSRMTLLDTLRERLQLTGSKKGCDHGQCGACTVIVNNKRVLSCLTLAATCEGKSVQTIEGFAKNGVLHPVQAAFLKHDGFQCGFCTPGQICSGIALMNEVKNGEASYVTPDIRTVNKNIELSDDEIRERMSGNICRCGAYANIIAAIKEVLSGKEVAQHWLLVPAINNTIVTNPEQHLPNVQI
ncbi:MAG: 2Fe-2S iron-sulfur cluster-binding protein [Chitinophagaceae bacterium]